MRSRLASYERWLPGLVSWLLLGLLAWGILTLLSTYRDLPEVHTSYLTRECVRVVDADGKERSCDPLPRFYRPVWVE